MRALIYFSVFLFVGCSAGKKDLKDHDIDKLKVESSKYLEIDNRPAVSYLDYINNDELTILIDESILNNKRINDARYRINLAKVNANITEAIDDPLFTTGLGYTIYDEINGNLPSTKMLDANITVSYEFDLWGKFNTLEKLSLLDLTRANLNLEKVTQEVVYEVTSLYIELAIENKIKHLLIRSLDIVKSQLRAIEFNFSKGYASESEVLLFKNNLNAYYDMMNIIDLGISIKKDKLVRITGYKEGLRFFISEKQYQNSLVSSRDFETSIFLNVNIAIAMLNELESKLNSQYELLQYYPMLTISATITSESDELKDLIDNPIGTLASGLLFPILNYNKISMVMERTDIEYFIEVNDVLKAVESVQFDYMEKLNYLKNYNVNHNVKNQIKSLSENKLNHSLSMLDAGEISQLEYFDSVLESYREEQDYLEFIKGKLLLQSELFIFYGAGTLLTK